MGYYLRVLTKNDARVPATRMRERLAREKIDAFLEVTDGSDEAWEELLLRHPDGKEIAQIWRNPVAEGELGGEEVTEFLEDIAEQKPETAAEWLLDLLPKVRVVYAFQVLFLGADRGQGWEAIRAVEGEIWGALGGIFQSDGEGFSNEEGYHILWQFAPGVKGSWRMAVLDKAGRWVPFEMDLGNPEHKAAFLDGRVPEKVSRP